MRLAACGAVLLAAAACAEMQRPPTPAIGFGDGPADPVRGAVAAMAPAFADRASGLAGQPVATAEAAARLEYVTAAVTSDARYAALPPGLRRELLLARTEVRDALGLAPEVTSEAAAGALMAAARALRAGNAAAAAAALPSPEFRPGGSIAVARLADIGPLPQAAIASALAAEEVARLDPDAAGLGSRPVEGTGSGTASFGLGGNAPRGF